MLARTATDEQMEKDMDMKLELVVLPVSDVDQAKAFYDQVGFHVDHDHRVSEDLRFVELTPPGSACSIAIGVPPVVGSRRTSHVVPVGRGFRRREPVRG